MLYCFHSQPASAQRIFFLLSKYCIDFPFFANSFGWDGSFTIIAVYHNAATKKEKKCGPMSLLHIYTKKTNKLRICKKEQQQNRK